MIGYKGSLWVAVLVALALNGCGKDRSHPTRNGGEAKSEVMQAIDTSKYFNPIADIHTEVEQHVKKENQNGAFVYNLYAYKDNQFERINGEKFMPDAFKFYGTNSKDQDENGEHIVSYDWNVTIFLENNTIEAEKCLNTSMVGDKLEVKLCELAEDDGNFTVTLKVTDDENQVDTTTQTVIFR